MWQFGKYTGIRGTVMVIVHRRASGGSFLDGGADGGRCRGCAFVGVAAGGGAEVAWLIVVASSVGVAMIGLPTSGTWSTVANGCDLNLLTPDGSFISTAPTTATAAVPAAIQCHGLPPIAVLTGLVTGQIPGRGPSVTARISLLRGIALAPPADVPGPAAR